MSSTRGSESNSAVEHSLHDPFSIVPTEFQVDILDKIWCSVMFYGHRHADFGGPLLMDTIFNMLNTHISLQYGPSSRGMRYDKDGEAPTNIKVFSPHGMLASKIWEYINRPVKIPGGETWDTYRVKKWSAQWYGIGQPERRGEIGYTALTLGTGVVTFHDMQVRRYRWPKGRKSTCREQERWRRGRFAEEEVYEGHPYDWRFVGHMDPDPLNPTPISQDHEITKWEITLAAQEGEQWTLIDDSVGIPSMELT
ncbi:hypothetical protein MMC11_002248 [Xylographa trunciseda]|nr:hypothetical protein [Xylographa trunciseda]